MSDLNAQAFTSVTLNANLETLLLTLPTVNVNAPGGEGIVVRSDVQVIPGTGATGVILRLYKGGFGGTVIATKTSGDANGASIGTLDTDTSLPATYAVSAQAVGSSTNGTASGLLECGVADATW